MLKMRMAARNRLLSGTKNFFNELFSKSGIDFAMLLRYATNKAGL